MKKTTKSDEDDRRTPSNILRSGSRPRELDITADDSFSEEKFISQPIRSGSWESQSLDSSSRPSSRLTDRRKQFDTTTPTLIDEEYEREDEAEMASLEHTRYQGTFHRHDDIRRTPNLKLNEHQHSQQTTSTFHSTQVGVRKTPGATQKPSVIPKGEESLGFGLMLSTPLEDRKKSSIWQQGTRESEDNVKNQQDTKGPFSFSTWGSKSPSLQQDNRQGAFSPNILRLTEDIGSLLQEDDDYAAELPKVLKGNETSEVQGDWTGSYNVFQAKDYVPLPGVQKTTDSRDRIRRRPHASESPFSFAPSHQQPHGTQNTQQPIPRRMQNEIFEFGKQRNVASPAQPLNFGGAFAPPPSQGAFLRPVAASPVGGFRFNPSSTASYSFNASGGVFQQTTAQGSQPPPGYSPMPPGFDSKLPPQASSIPRSSNLPSNMMANAQEFVPSTSIGARTPTHWMQPVQPSPIPFGPIGEQQPWEDPMNYAFDPSFHYPMSQHSYGTRSSMTPSPHMQAWHDGSMFGMTPPPPMMDQLPYRQLPTPSQQMSISSFEPSQGSQSRQKKDPKRGKRGKRKTKMKQSQDRETPRAESVDLDAEGQATSDPLDARRAELIESPETRVAFKDFYRTFRSEEKISLQKAEEYATHVLETDLLPESVHWRVYLELADLSRRSNKYMEARRLYEKVCQLQPFASQGWLEYSKLEEDVGHMNRVTNILHSGLEYCEYSEGLLTRALKHQEKMGNLKGARELLSRLKHVGIDKVWKTVLEGALLEARAGNYPMARRVLKYIMHHVPWYGPLYLEAYKLERDLGNTYAALEIVERGVAAIPKYGPLWFGACRLCEELDMMSGDLYLPQTMQMLERGITNVSKELCWKVHVEAAQIFERAAQLQSNEDMSIYNECLVPARFRFSMTYLTCPQNMRWKVLVAAGRMEISACNSELARSVLMKAHQIAPDKGRSSTLLELTRLEEFEGNTDLASSILCKARVQYGYDWKVWFESSLFELRSKNYDKAMLLCMKSLEVHQGVGRLWALLIQLSQDQGGEQAQVASLRRALNAVPKSGEVWCEGARIHLNPFSRCFNVDRARRHLDFAIKFTPQYGDTYIEMFRLEIISQWLFPIAEYVWKKTKDAFDRKDLSSYLSEISKALAVACEIPSTGKHIHRDIVSTVRKKLQTDSVERIDIHKLQVLCGNADPNYGELWFHYRKTSTDSPRKVLDDASLKVFAQIQKHAFAHLVAIVRYLAIESLIQPSSTGTRGERADDDLILERQLDPALNEGVSLGEVFEKIENDEYGKGAESFTGLIGLYPTRGDSGSISERRKHLFGTDLLFI